MTNIRCEYQMCKKTSESLLFVSQYTIRNYLEYEGWIEKIIPRITVLQPDACGVMTNRDCEGHIFLSHSHTNNYFSVLTFKYRILTLKRLPEVLQHITITSLYHNNQVIFLSTYGCSIDIFHAGWYVRYRGSYMSAHV